MIGGNKRIMKRLLKCFDIFFIYMVILRTLNANPQSMPIMVVSPASYKYLCLDFFNKCPSVMESINKKSMIKISVDIYIYIINDEINVI
jgi:hypothetical protein